MVFEFNACENKLYLDITDKLVQLPRHKVDITQRPHEYGYTFRLECDDLEISQNLHLDRNGYSVEVKRSFLVTFKDIFDLDDSDCEIGLKWSYTDSTDLGDNPICLNLTYQNNNIEFDTVTAVQYKSQTRWALRSSAGYEILCECGGFVPAYIIRIH